MYADDLTLLLSGTSTTLKESIKGAWEILKEFELSSGLAININKTQFLTNCEDIDETDYGDFVFVKTTSVLGITVASSTDEAEEKNDIIL
ncbi:Uncharacterized protein FKW44_010288 [Caligus rogercresseyi]|uniref:Reverse transcriptase domain-containing protein n=1 Tax=Caligus rogercresseyi TaxID=217165 RepID=A0A7T8HGJ4_CALRO|nr:Uncharacterized protein FKW44_010288 [Caligus rogercresseyi]